MGFKTEYLLHDPPEDCICPVCRGVLIDPRRLTPCGHILCAACIQFDPWKSPGICSSCEEKVWRKPTRLPRSFTNRILSLEGRCHLDCGFKGSLGMFPRHIRNDCPNATAFCPNRKRGCYAEMQRIKVEEHLLDCSFRMTSCEGCGKRMLFSKLQAHQARHRCVEARLTNEKIRADMRNSKDVREHWLSIRFEQVALRSQITRIRSSRLEARRLSLREASNAMQRGQSRLSARWQRLQPPVIEQRAQSSPAGCLDNRDDVSNKKEAPIKLKVPNVRQSLRTADKECEEDGYTEYSDDMSFVVPSEYSSGSVGGSTRTTHKSVEGMLTSRSETREESDDVIMTCGRCDTTYRKGDNHDRICCWHRGVSNHKKPAC